MNKTLQIVLYIKDHHGCKRGDILKALDMELVDWNRLKARLSYVVIVYDHDQNGWVLGNDSENWLDRESDRQLRRDIRLIDHHIQQVALERVSDQVWLERLKEGHAIRDWVKSHDPREWFDKYTEREERGTLMGYPEGPKTTGVTRMTLLMEG